MNANTFSSYDYYNISTISRQFFKDKIGVNALRILRQGSKGFDVTDLQTSLKRLGYDSGPTDGIYGSVTKRAIIQFQMDNGLSPDGLAGPITLQALQSKTIKPTLTRTVAGWIPAWVQTQSFRSIQVHPNMFQILSPFWYVMTPTGDITKLSGSENSTILAFASFQGISIVPLINNNFNSQLSSTVLNDPSLRQNHIINITNLVKQMNYAGIEINYENLFVNDKQIFVQFLQELKTALAPLNKQLIVDVHAKTDVFGTWSGAEADDYVGIGQVADLVRIMAYDNHTQASDPGPIAPADWVEAVLIYGTSTIPSNKIVLGVPTYGYDWPVGQSAKLISYASAIAIANKYNVPIINDAILGPHFAYTVNNTGHEVWFTNTSSFSALLDLVNKYAISGVCMWYPGLEDPGIYNAIQTKLSSVPSVQSPSP